MLAALTNPEALAQVGGFGTKAATFDAFGDKLGALSLCFATGGLGVCP